MLVVIVRIMDLALTRAFIRKSIFLHWFTHWFTIFGKRNYSCRLLLQ